MKFAIAAVVIAAVFASAATASTRPALRYTTTAQGVVVTGTGFASAERVRVLLAADGAWTRTVRTTAQGTLRALFDAAQPDRCSAVIIRAFGRTGDRAVLKVIPRGCITERSP